VTSTNKPSVKTRNTGVITGIDQHVTGNATIGGVAYTPATLKAVFSEHNAAIDAADVLHKKWQDQVNAMRAAGKKAHAVYLFLRSFVIGQYGDNANAILNDFGMTAPKARGPKTVKTKVIGIDKRAATRAVRHTMGKIQKKNVKGTTVAPTTAPAPVTATPASPAPAVPLASPPKPTTG
jgi:hypothetical protein